MNIQDTIIRAVEIKKKYDILNKKNGVEWKDQDFMSGFVGDVGDLSKLVMAKHGLRGSNDVDAELAHELADCLWSVCVLASEYNIDLEAAFIKTMDELDLRLDKQTQN